MTMFTFDVRSGSSGGGGGGPNGIQLFFSSVIGNDITGDGSYSAPVATPQAAADLAASTSVPVTVTGLDNATYDGTIVTSNPLISFAAPYATFVNSGSGSVVTFNGAGTIFFSCYEIEGGANPAFTFNGGSGSIGIFVGSVLQGDIDNTGTGGGSPGVSINVGSLLIGNITNPNAAEMSYSCQTRSGTDDSNVFGATVTGSNSTWLVPGQLTASGLNYPTVDGSMGDVVTSDGSGNLTLQPSGGGSTPGWVPLAIPFNAWLGPTGSFQVNGDTSVTYQIPFSARSGGTQNGAPGLSSTQDFGSVTFSVPVDGTYNFNFTHNVNGDGGILSVDLDSGATVTNVDFYGTDFKQVTASWTTDLTAGDHTLALYCNSNNMASSNRWIYVIAPLFITRIA